MTMSRLSLPRIIHAQTRGTYRYDISADALGRETTAIANLTQHIHSSSLYQSLDSRIVPPAVYNCSPIAARRGAHNWDAWVRFNTSFAQRARRRPRRTIFYLSCLRLSSRFNSGPAKVRCSLPRSPLSWRRPCSPRPIF
ncbi:hypothetical protein F4680DRAFT_89876 [Xylaria scruposa]|nr:hypothetical protein F4680DRAFT_89876 [Xylaria scruposa]